MGIIFTFNYVALIPLVLLILGFVWGIWLIFRKGDMVSQPMKIVGYFAGALLALIIAVLLTVLFFPFWANQMLGVATQSDDIQQLQQKTEQLMATAIPTVKPPASPVATPPTTGTSSRGATGVEAGEVEYTVQMGENLYRIALKFNVTQKCIIDRNKITDPNNIRAGQKLIIPQCP